MPFAGYKDFADCVNKNQDKEDPEAYCGSIKHKVEDVTYGKRVGSTYMSCPRCGDIKQKTIYRKVNKNVARCRNCGHSWNIKDDIIYVKGYFKTGVDIKTPNVNCMRDHLNKTLEHSPDIDLETALQNAQNFCISETDFGNITLDEYMLLRGISIKLAQKKMDFYIINDAMIMSQVTPGKTLRVEPMKTLAEASTGGKKSSSNIEKVGYFNNMLEVEFHSGENYIYFVEPGMYDKFVEAPSKGKFLWNELRGKKTGLVWGYATGTGSKMKYTPGGVGGSIVPYAKGTSGAPEFEPRLPTERERALIQKEIQIQFLGKGLKYKEHDPDLKRQETIQELRSVFAQQPQIKPKTTTPEISPKEQILEKIKKLKKQKLISPKEQIFKKIQKIKAQEKTISPKERILKKVGRLKQMGTPKSSVGEKESKEVQQSKKEILLYLKEKLKEIQKRMETATPNQKKNLRKIMEQIRERIKLISEKSDFQEFNIIIDCFEDIEEYLLNISLLNDKVNNLEDFGVCKKSYKLQYDFYHTEDEKKRNKLQKTIKKYDINIKNDTTLRGVITRAGAFDYGGKIVYKDWNNILENAAIQPILPVFGSKYTNPHKEENIPHLIGYVNNWGIDNPEKEWLYGDIHTFEPIAEISDLPNPKDIQVSLSMFDDSNENAKFQHIVGFRNVAIALNNQLEGRCDSVDGYGSCIVSPTGDLTNHANLLKLDKSSVKRPSESSSPNLEPRKIIKKKSDLHMPDENKVKEEIAKFIEDFKAKQKDDAGSIVTGNEVAGHTLHDEFIRTMLDEGFSPASAESAWLKYNAQGKEAGADIPINTGGFVKTPAGIGDFEEQLKTLAETVENQSKDLKKYEDFFKAEQLKKEADLKIKYKQPLSEEGQKIIEKMDFEDLEKIKPVLDLYIKEHPEILPVKETADQIGDMNTTEILKLLGKSKDDLRKTKSDIDSIKEHAEKAMEAKWSKK